MKRASQTEATSLMMRVNGRRGEEWARSVARSAGTGARCRRRDPLEPAMGGCVDRVHSLFTMSNSSPR
jgi:hypothetical protein